MAREGRKLTRKALNELFADISPRKRQYLMRRGADLSIQCIEEAAASEKMGALAKSEALRNAVEAFSRLGDMSAKALEKQETAAKIIAGIAAGKQQRQPIVVQFISEDATPDEAVNNTVERVGSDDSESAKDSSKPK